VPGEQIEIEEKAQQKQQGRYEKIFPAVLLSMEQLRINF